MSGYDLARPLLFSLPSETAHAATLAALRCSGRLLGPPGASPAASTESVAIWGHSFSNRIGLAAGFDKNAVAIDGLARLGFGFIEVGAVTPRPQAGQEAPRLFRLTKSRSLINRMGFPNDGAAVVAARLATRRWRGPVGVNIGKNADTPLKRAVDDYVACFRALHALSDYLVLNVSSPNTAGLRDLQARERLEPILTAILDERRRVSTADRRDVPLLVKLSPDLQDDELTSVAALIQRLGLDGVIATNSTLARDAAATPGEQHAQQVGGLSGPALLPKSLTVVRRLRSVLGKEVVIVGVGGVGSGADALAMRAAGADLVQIYTGLVYRGPSLIRECRTALTASPGSGGQW